MRLGLHCILGSLVLLPCAAASQSWCSEAEKTYFHCTIAQKHVSVCGIAKAGQLRYMFGRDRQNPELAVSSAGYISENVFRFGAESRSAKGGIWNLQFHRGGFTYTVYRFRHSFEEHSAGVAVANLAGRVTYLKCVRSGLVDNLPDLEIFQLPPLSHGEFVEAPN